MLEELEEYWELENKRNQLTELAKELGTNHPQVLQLNIEVDQLALRLQGYILDLSTLKF